MDADTFWDIIEQARASAGPGVPFHEALTAHLATLGQQDILEYQEQFDEAMLALYRWHVWAAAFLIGSGCSDDGFIDFRAGLIAQGRDWYRRVAASPDSLAAHPAVAALGGPGARRPWESVLFYEEVNYAPSYAFQRLTGDDHAFYDAWQEYYAAREHGSWDEADMGEDFDFNDDEQMRRRLPRLFALCRPGD